MARGGHWRLLGGGLLAFGLAGSGGCFWLINSCPDPLPEAAETCQAVSAWGRRHVYVFLANGVDPLGLGDLAGVRDHVRALGFPKIYYGQFCHGGWFEREIRRLHKECPEARFMLIGYGHGA